MKHSDMMPKKASGMHKMPDGKMMKDSAMKKMASGGMTSALAKHASKPASKAHSGLKEGGMPMVMKDGKKIPAFAAKKGGMTKMAHGGMAHSGMAKGGGIESKGKTKGTMVKMKSGGRAC
jgi:hypothetical protein